MTRRPAVCAIVVSYNRAGDLRLAIEALQATRYDPLEIIVVDNGSHDGSADAAQAYPGVKVIRNAANEGFAAANNRGLIEATGDYVALVNNDAVVALDWIDGLVAFLESHPEAAAAGGKMYRWDEANPLGARGNAFHAYTRVDPSTGDVHTATDAPDRVREVATLSGAGVLVRRAAIDAIGEPFLEPLFFTYYEETDFFARAIRNGWRLYYTGEPAAWHRIRAATNGYHYRYHMERNRLLFAYRNFSDRCLRRALAIAAARAVAAVPVAVGRALVGGGKGDASGARRDAWKWLFEHRDLLREHRARYAARGAPYDEVLSAIAARAELGA